MGPPRSLQPNDGVLFAGPRRRMIQVPPVVWMRSPIMGER
jgi:hypothetical protein